MYSTLQSIINGAMSWLFNYRQTVQENLNVPSKIIKILIFLQFIKNIMFIQYTSIHSVVT